MGTTVRQSGVIYRESKNTEAAPLSISFKKVLTLPISAWAVIALFFLKAVVLSLWIIPLWDIPDEIGHFAYARDIASGKGILPMGKAEIEEDIMTDLNDSKSSPAKNYIVQHPPLYHAIAGVAWRIAGLLTNNSRWLFRAPRIVSALFGAMTLLFIYKLLQSFHLSEKLSLAVTASFSAIPMFTWMSAGTNHDTTAAFFGAVSAYYFHRYFKDKKRINAYLSVFSMSLAAATKMTALVLLAPLATLLLLETGGEIKTWLSRSAKLIIAALFVPSMWLIHNFLAYGNFLATYANTMERFRLQDHPLHTTFFSFLQNQPAVEYFHISFFGLIGGIGTGRGSPKMFQISPPYLTLYDVVVFFICLLSAIYFGRLLFKGASSSPSADASILDRLHRRIPNRFRTVSMHVLILLSLCVLMLSHKIVSATVASIAIVPSYSLIFFLFASSVIWFLVPIEKFQRQFVYSILILAVFSYLLLWEIYKIHLLDGRLRATQGRYFYPALGFIVIGFVAPSMLMLGRWAERLALPAAVAICFTEAAFYANKVLPYVYSGGVAK